MHILFILSTSLVLLLQSSLSQEQNISLENNPQYLLAKKEFVKAWNEAAEQIGATMLVAAKVASLYGPMKDLPLTLIQTGIVKITSTVSFAAQSICRIMHQKVGLQNEDITYVENENQFAVAWRASELGIESIPEGTLLILLGKDPLVGIEFASSTPHDIVQSQTPIQSSNVTGFSSTSTGATVPKPATQQPTQPNLPVNVMQIGGNVNPQEEAIQLPPSDISSNIPQSVSSQSAGTVTTHPATDGVSGGAVQQGINQKPTQSTFPQIPVSSTPQAESVGIQGGMHNVPTSIHRPVSHLPSPQGVIPGSPHIPVSHLPPPQGGILFPQGSQFPSGNTQPPSIQQNSNEVGAGSNQGQFSNEVTNNQNSMEVISPAQGGHEILPLHLLRRSTKK